MDGAVAGVWRRQRRRFTIALFPGRDELQVRVAEAARALPLPGDPDETVIDWEGELQ